MKPDRRGLVRLMGAATGGAVLYGPRFARAGPDAMTLDLAHADGRRTAFRALAPTTGGTWGLVLFSHGANASNAAYDRLWRPWRERGFLVIGANHLDSGPKESQRQVPRPVLWNARVEDLLLPLARRGPFDAMAAAAGAVIDWERPCAAGHSFGAVVAQAVAGATLQIPGDAGLSRRAAPEAKACIALSPPGPLAGFIPEDAWATVQAPCLLQTGDADILKGFVDDWRRRLIGFSGGLDRWVLIGHGVDHYFGGQICRLAPGGEAQSPALEETAAATGDFLLAYGRGDSAARRRLTRRAQTGDDSVARFAQA